MYLRWRYNNIRIKEGDEQKVAFLIPEGIFEPSVIFFELTNSLVTFQTMINDLLRDMIETEDIAAFINNVMVGMETKERHDEIVEKVLKKMVENDLFVKLNKCIQKIREIGFLEVIIGPDGVKMEKEKVQEVIDWLIPRSVKNVQKFEISKLLQMVCQGIHKDSKTFA